VCPQALKGENAELEALARKVDGLESDKAAVKQRLTDAITKVGMGGWRDSWMNGRIDRCIKKLVGWLVWRTDE